MSKWIKVKDYSEIPEGEWLVMCNRPIHGLYIQSASINPNVSIIGGLFAFDQPTVIAYRELPVYDLEGGEDIMEDGPDLAVAPWTDQQVRKLIIRQANPHFHPYTCECGEELTPTTNGWYCEVNDCDYCQDWCLAQDVGEEDV